MKRALPGIALVWLLIAIAFATCGPAAADTGTYRILRYTVSIEPQPDGSWVADYSQEWKVTGGHIPWVTVGLPHSDYAILSSSGAAVSVSRGDEGSWSGIRVTLDDDYRSGETFGFGFRVRQARMGYRKADAVEFSFVPGWYDRADTERLEIRLKNPGTPDDLLFTSPDPSERTANEAVWITRLGRGERFRVSFAFSADLFPGLPERRAPVTPGGVGVSGAERMASISAGVVIAILVLLVVLSVLARAGRGGYRGRRGIYYGSYFPLPPVGRPSGGSRTTRPSGGSGSPGGSRRTGGGGGFGGRSIGCACVACACACVSCACACACAGGGGAGCARKFDGTRNRLNRRAAEGADVG